MDVSRETGRVTRLSLASNGLTGELPSELGNFGELEELLLADNPELTRCVPPSLRSTLTRLTGAEFCDASPGDAQAIGHRDDRPVSPDRAALVKLYNATDGENWRTNDNWLSDRHIDEWSGVTVDAEGRVIKLDLARQGLKGEIPAELSALANLRELSLGDNELTGEIPAELANLRKLESLYLSGNRLTGEIPPELSNLSELEELYLSSNRLEGEIPSELGSMPRLRQLALDRNRLTGEIPPELSNLPEEAKITVAGGRLGPGANNFSGCLPVLLRWRLPSAGLLVCTLPATSSPSPEQVRSALEAFYKATNGPGWRNDRNWFTDAPFSQWAGVFAHGDKIVGLNFRNYNLEGTIPPELGDLSDLEILNLMENRLAGPIPPELGRLSQLGALHLSDNQLSGEIPPELGKLYGLTQLSLDSNQLTGPIPAELGDLSFLTELGLSVNRLSGTIPPELGKLSELRILVIAGNRLGGEVPPELADLAKLEWLYLSGNELVGCIPKELQAVEENDLEFSDLPSC